tara:strand:- start:1500 stop:1757 length:258 start_codon:yes stop_codon:yes gene_type:complete
MVESKKIKALKKQLETLRKQLDIYKDKEIARLQESNKKIDSLALPGWTELLTGVTTTNPFQPIQYFKFGTSGTFSPTNKLSTINN